MSDKLATLASNLLGLLGQTQSIITTAESCTGGWVAKVLTDIAGSSSAFEQGFITYSNSAKIRMLGVSADTLNNFGAVSENTVAEMTTGALQKSDADYAVAISGIAGPGGGTTEKPVGMVCFAWASKTGKMKTETRHFTGDRESVRYQSVQYSLQEAQLFIQDRHY